MKCLYYSEYGKVEVSDLPVPVFGPDEVLIKVLACGICGSELETFKSRSHRRKPPIIMGHEFSGIVQALGARVSGFQRGQHVVSHSLVSCSHCAACQREDTHLCVNRQIFGMHRNGAFSEYVNVPASSLIAIEKQVDPREACLSEPLANGIHMVNLTRHLRPEKIAIIGAGPIGLMALQAFKALTACTLVIADISRERLVTAQRLGAQHTICVTAENFNDCIDDIFSGGADLIIDAVGSRTTNEQALNGTRPGGAVVLIGLLENANSFYTYEIILKEKQLIGTYAASRQELKHALALIEDQVVDVRSWITYASLSESEDAFHKMLHPPADTIKTVLIP